MRLRLWSTDAWEWLAMRHVVLVLVLLAGSVVGAPIVTSQASAHEEPAERLDRNARDATASTTAAANTRTNALRRYDASPNVSRSPMPAGGLRLATKAGGDVAQLGGPLRNALRAKAGFKSTGEPIIVDPSIGANPQRVAAALRAQGVNARSVREAFGRDDIEDPDILQVTGQLGGRVIASDRGRKAGGFGSRVIRTPQRVRSPEDVVRLFMEGG